MIFKSLELDIVIKFITLDGNLKYNKKVLLFCNFIRFMVL